MIVGKNTPELRFPGFTGEWEEKKMGEVFEFRKGKGISKSELSVKGNKCILYGQLYTIYDETITSVKNYTEIDKEKLLLSKYGDILIPSSGETAMDMSLASAILLDGIALGGDINVLRSKENEIDSRFMSYQINSVRKLDLAKIAEGASVIHLYNSSLKSIKINLPSLPEQDKIGSFFSSLDRKLELQKERIEELKSYKKGMMQRIFNQEIRFKDKNGKNYPDWEEKKLGEVVKLQGGYAFKSIDYKNKGIPIIRISNIKDMIDLESDIIYSEDYKIPNEYIVKNGDLLIAMSGATTGKIGIYKCGNIAYLNQRCGKFIGCKDLFYKYLYSWTKSDNFKKQLSLRLIAGAQPNISGKDIESMFINLPSLPEQEKIASFLSAIDRKLELEEEKLEAYEKLKKGLMQRMFI